MDRDRSEPQGSRRSLVAKVAMWLVVTAVGLAVVLQLMFLAIEIARPLIGPIPDDSAKERMLVAAGNAVWFALSALVSLLAWRRLVSR